MSDFIRDDDGASNVSSNPHLHQLIEREIARNPARRHFLKSGASLGLLGVFGSTLAACGGGSDAPAPGSIGFKAVAAQSGSAVVVPEGYTADVLYRWGDPCVSGAPEFAKDAS